MIRAARSMLADRLASARARLATSGSDSGIDDHQVTSGSGGSYAVRSRERGHRAATNPRVVAGCRKLTRASDSRSAERYQAAGAKLNRGLSWRAPAAR